MNAPESPAAAAESSRGTKKARSRRARQGNSLLAQGEPSVWATGGALTVAILMIVGLLAIVFIQGVSTFWPKDVIQIRTIDGKKLLGEWVRDETYKPAPTVFDKLPPDVKERAIKSVKDLGGFARRRLLRIGSKELGESHRWISDFQLVEETKPEWDFVIERYVNGRFYGTPIAFIVEGEVVATNPEKIWSEFSNFRNDVQKRIARQIYLSKHVSGAVKRKEEEARLAARQAEISYGKGAAEHAAAEEKYAEVKRACKEEDESINAEIKSLKKTNVSLQMRLVTADGNEKTLTMDEIVRAYPANQLGFWDKVGVYCSRWGEFLWDNPRESSTEGGVFPPIWGMVALTLLLSLAVVPFGVLAALYLREYAKSGPIISAVRIAINNLAGVPSIVFGVFGLGFFCYLVGAFIDGGPRNIQVNPWPAGFWWIGMVVAVVAGVAGFLVGVVGAGNASKDSLLGKYLGIFATLLWLLSLVTIVFLIIKTPYFHGFYEADLPKSTFGKGGLLWASLTLALLTVPVVIVATEEALAAVPNSMREGSYACGASKWQTIRYIVLPRALPGIMTGLILAMARGAGEVAPIMIVGASHFVQLLPIDDVFPFVHLERSFQHLGYYIYHRAFNDPDSEASRPVVFTATLVLVAIVFLLNVTAIWLRSRLRRRYLVSQF
jgi:ABC-type phosphate transport system permease subunit/ABC-type phosphate transport system auxiliary subunit